LKAVRSLDLRVGGLRLDDAAGWTEAEISSMVAEATDLRLFALAEALRQGRRVDDLVAQSGIDRFFIAEIARIVSCEERVAGGEASLAQAKRLGFSDAEIAALLGSGESEVRARRMAAGLVPVYKIVDTCAGEFPAATPYYYSTYEAEDERPESHRPRIVVLGAGPIRIGQGIEFDYSTVHAVKALREAGYEAVIINNNPETVSTDFDISDRLYFEPLTVEDVLHVVSREQPDGVLVQFGGQTALNLAGPLRDAGVRILGTSVRSLDISEDREKFSLLLTALGIERPEGGDVWSLPACEALLHRIGLPVVVRPSYVLGGRTVPFVSKAVGMPLVQVATRVMLGDTLADFGFSDVHQLPAPSRVAVKAPVFSMEKLPRAEAAVGPEMRSTGEVMGLCADAATALHRALVAAGWHNRERSILVSLADRHKEQA